MKNLRGELHAHSTSSDGSHSIEQIAIAANPEFSLSMKWICLHRSSMGTPRAIFKLCEWSVMPMYSYPKSRAAIADQ
jgi:hypothetical protein